MATKIEEKKVSFKDILKTTWDATVKSYRWLNKHPVRMTVIISLVMCLIVEILARKSLWEAGVFAGTNMVVFLYDSLIIFSTMCISLLIPKRKFVLLLGIILWLGLGITNCVILGFRITPFEATDFSMLKAALTMTSIYMQWWQVVLIIGGFIAAAVLLTFAFIKLKKGKILTMPEAEHKTAEVIKITPKTDYVVNVDGELYENIPFEVEIVKNALKVYR